jgi:hypothetical protein
MALTEEQIREHYRHKCSTGYDPLLCVHLVHYPIEIVCLNTGGPGETYDRVKHPEDVKHYKHVYYHIDQIITEDRYVELIQKTNSDISDLTDYDKIECQNIWKPTDNADEEYARIFWLKPTAKCKTLTDLYNQYEARIKILFNGG